MYREQTVIALFIFGVTLASAVGFAVAWFNANRRARRLEGRLMSGAQATEPRTEQLEQAIEALASQVDQLASGQEFLSRILSDRLDKVARALPEAERAMTPH